MSDAVCVLLFALTAMVLQFGMLGQIIQPLQLDLIGVGAERFAVDGDKASDVSVRRLDDCLGGVVPLVDSAQEIPDRMMVLSGVQPVLYGAANQCSGVKRYGGHGLTERDGCEYRWQQSEE